MWGELRKQGDPGVAAKMLNVDTNNMENLDVISMWHQFKAPKLSRDEAEAVAYSEAGVDLEAMEEEGFKLNKAQAGRLAVKAQEIRDNINSLISNVEVPDVPNPYKELISGIEDTQKQSEELATKWVDSYGEKLEESLDHVEFKDFDFEYEIDNDSKTELVKEMISYAVKEGMQPTESNIKDVIKVAKELYLQRNAKKIMSAAIKNAVTKSEDKFDEKINNTKPINKEESPKELHDDKLKDLGDRVLKDMGIS